MARSSAVSGILRIVKIAGELDTRIRLQKEAFLLAVASEDCFSVDDFDYHHYGPYSRVVSDSLRYAVVMGLVDEHAHSFDESGEHVRYSYSLTEEGASLVDQESSMNETSALIEELNKHHWRSLELAATIRFLEIREGFNDREAALSEALRLKPATKPYVDDAKKVLDFV
ncbi:hypothetical protein [Rhizobium leguminosarum]|uniref:hypothetical protein n=1 Tax=Rhizobium leguminosarum TaxID=384 RepID=UPI00143F47F8|nr:hypothetical protein [Rhizobium leguminosarum]NKL23489.1 hypothetical protein [Rhizobium leguminosarum bv. viciae]